MIVVAIIGILVAVGMPQYQNYVARAQVGEGLSMASSIKTAISEYFSINGNFPDHDTDEKRHTALGINTAYDFKGNYVRGIIVKKKGKFEILFKEAPDAHTLIAEKSFYMIPKNEGGSISWRCACESVADTNCAKTTTNRPILKKFLPSSCLLASNSGGDTDDLHKSIDKGDIPLFDGDKDDILLPPVPEPDTDTDPLPTKWKPDEMLTDDQACWDQSVADSASDGLGWVVGKLSPKVGPGTIHWAVPGHVNSLANASYGSGGAVLELDWNCYP